MRYWLLILCCLTTLACNLSIQSEKPTAAPPSLPTAFVSTIQAAPLLPVRDATPMISGACFEAFQALDGQWFVLENESALTDFYNHLDSLCAQPVPRTPFDFTNEILVIAFKSAQACTVEFIPQSITENILMLQWRQTGNCSYEVVAIYAGALDRAYSGLQVNLSNA